MVRMTTALSSAALFPAVNSRQMQLYGELDISYKHMTMLIKPQLTVIVVL